MSTTRSTSKHKQAFETKLRQMYSEKNKNATTFTKEKFDKVAKFCQESQELSDKEFKHYNKQLLSDDDSTQGHYQMKKYSLIEISGSSTLTYKH